MNKKNLRLGVIGVSPVGIGNVYVNSILHYSDAELIAICDSNEETLKDRAEFYGIKNAYTDYHDLLSHDDIDAVCITTIDQAHKEITIAALRAGKDVLCEKPMALSGDDCRDMLDVARETGRKLMVGQICRFTPSFVLAKKLVEAGEIGDLFFVESEYAHMYSNENTTWRGSDPMRNVVIGGGCHAVDLLRWFVGNPIEVSAYGNQKVNDFWKYDDCTVASMKFQNDVIGKVMVSGGCRRGYTMRTCLYGTEGTIVVDNTSSTMSLYKEEFGGMTSFHDLPMHNIELKIPVEINNHNAPEEIRTFIDIILNDKEVTIDGVQGCNTVIACEAIVESSKTGAPVKPVYYE